MPVALGIANSPVFSNLVVGGSVTPPDAPTNLAAVVNGSDVDLTWTDNSTDEDGFKIYRSSDNIVFVEIDDIAAGSTAYTDLDPGSGTWYYYVVAYNAGGESASNIGSVETLVLDGFASYKKSTIIGSPPLVAMGSAVVGSDIYLSVMNFSGGIYLYKTPDNGTSWSLIKTVYANGSGRSHPSCATDGVDTIWIAVSSGRVKRYTISTDTLGSEINIGFGSTDASILHMSGTGDAAVLLCFQKTVVGLNFEIRCYRSADGGATWSLYSTPHTEAAAGINQLEDLDSIVAGNGDVLLSWEREVVEKGEASCRQRISADGGATWGTETTIVDNATFDDEGGSYVLDVNGDIGNTNDLFYVYGSNKNGGISYDFNQLFRLKSTDNGATWGSEILVLETYSTVEVNAIIDSNGQMLLAGTKHYSAAEAGTFFDLVSVHAVEPGNRHLSDGGWTQDGGLAYVVGNVFGKTAVRVDGEPRTNTRGFLANSLPATGNYIFEVDVLCTSDEFDVRIFFGYQNVNNHYMVNILGTIGSPINQIIVYRRVSGTYTSLNSQSFTPVKNTWYTVKVVWLGTSIKIYVDDVLYNDFTNATYSSGRIALGGLNVATRFVSYFANVQVTSI